MLLFGVPTSMAMVVLPMLRQHRIDTHLLIKRAKRVLVVSAIMLIVGAIALFVAQVEPLDLGFTTLNEWGAFAQESLLGHMTVVRVILGALALVALATLRRLEQFMTASAVIALLIVATITRTSHSTAMNDGWLPVVADFVHLLSGAVWGGGLVAVWLTLALLPQGDGLEAGATLQATHALIRRFSPLGIASVALVCSAGLLLSAARLPNSDALTTTQYGQLLLLKTVGVVVAVMLAGLHKFVSVRRMRTVKDARAFTRTLRIEACVVLAVFACAAALTSAMPPHKTMTHTMPDGPTMRMSLTDPNFERLLTVVAGMMIVTGAVALALEWRVRSQTNS